MAISSNSSTTHSWYLKRLRSYHAAAHYWCVPASNLLVSHTFSCIDYTFFQFHINLYVVGYIFMYIGICFHATSIIRHLGFTFCVILVLLLFYHFCCCRFWHYFVVFFVSVVVYFGSLLLLYCGLLLLLTHIVVIVFVIVVTLRRCWYVVMLL